MSKREGILLTLLAGLGIVLIVGGIWGVKFTLSTEKKEKVSYEVDKTVTALSSNVIVQEEHKLNEIDPQLKLEEKLINDFATAKIQYQFGDLMEVVDKDLITQWISVEEAKVVLHEDEVEKYVEELANKYDTVGTSREFVNSHGEVVEVSGGPYGWKINQEEEKKALVELIRKGKTQLNREPIYKSKAFTRGETDIGNTYVEVNLTEQKMWFYKEGELIVSTDIVSGNMARGHKTPAVVGYIHNKARNVVLVGTGYEAFVNYWMKIYGSIGIHDASWRKKFGGNIYKTNGSHGCINTPYDNVKKIYENIEIGTPVIVFYENE